MSAGCFGVVCGVFLYLKYFRKPGEYRLTNKKIIKDYKLNFKTRIMKFNISREAIVRIMLFLFCVGIVIGASIAYKEDCGKNLPIPIIMIFVISIGFALSKRFRNSL